MSAGRPQFQKPEELLWETLGPCSAHRGASTSSVPPGPALPTWYSLQASASLTSVCQRPEDHPALSPPTTKEPTAPGPWQLCSPKGLGARLRGCRVLGVLGPVPAADWDMRSGGLGPLIDRFVSGVPTGSGVFKQPTCWLMRAVSPPSRCLTVVPVLEPPGCALG